MPSKNINSHKWKNSEIFSEILAFEDFEARVNSLPEEKDRGDVFEIFIEGYLATQSIAQCRAHWVVGSIPAEIRRRYNLPSDGTGIDGIYTATDGTHVAYQVKYRQRQNLTYQEVASFLGLTERFNDRVIFTNASTLAHQAVARTRWVGRQNFLSLTSTALNEITSWIKSVPIERKRAEPDPRHQTAVLADIATALAAGPRATVVMACGTGKTLVALWAAERAKPRSVLVLLPSLSLVQQTIREWARHHNWGSQFAFICVCSDPTVTNNDDLIELETSDIGFRVDTDPQVIREFLIAPGDTVRIVFSTYQSSDVVAAGTQGLEAFDIGIFDEAHKTTGLAGGKFGLALSDANVAIKKRLFFTATPRHIDIHGARDVDGEYAIRSMDDASFYGPKAHTLSFKAAAEKGIICPYKVVISVVNKELVDRFVLKNGITLVDGDELGVQWVANIIALRQAIEQTGALKVITFHSRINLAREFAAEGPRGIGWHLSDFRVFHVNGRQRSSDRADMISSFSNSQRSIITNARCLTEGVDIPAVDMVAFIDPRQSRVDIAQAAGRAMRKPRGATNKKIGYMFVPLFVGNDGESICEAVKRSNFDAVADVLNALQEHDEELVDLIRVARKERGEGKKFKPRLFGEKINFIGPQVDFGDVVESIETKLISTLGSSWDEWYGKLLKYKAEFGDVSVSQDYQCSDGSRLGSWVSNQRAKGKLGTLAPRRVALLNEMGFVWNPVDDGWQQFLADLDQFKSNNGHLDIPRDYVVEGRSVGQRVQSVRSTYRNSIDESDRLSAEFHSNRKLELERRSFIWDIMDYRWNVCFQGYKNYIKKNNVRFVPRGLVFEGWNISAWARNQRSARRDSNPELTDERVKLLDEVGFDWDPFDSSFDSGAALLRVFFDREGHCDVPQRHKESDFPLGVWCNNMRRRYLSGRMSSERIVYLSNMGFIWEPKHEAWKGNFESLRSFVLRFGLQKLSKKYKSENGISLASWLNSQKHQFRLGRLTQTKIKLLEGLGVNFSEENSAPKVYFDLEKYYSSMEKFKASVGHLDVPSKYVTRDGLKLGKWLAFQKKQFKKGLMSANRATLLEAMGVDLSNLTPSSNLRANFEDNCAKLKEYQARVGHLRVPVRYVTDDGVRLGKWLRQQKIRFNNGGLPEDILMAMQALGVDLSKMGWVSSNGEDFEKIYESLKVFHSSFGNLKIKKTHVTKDGIRLGEALAEIKADLKSAEFTEDQREKLASIGIQRSKVVRVEWEKNFAELDLFVRKHGSAEVPKRYVTNEGLRLGQWLQNQKSQSREGKLVEERRTRLQAIGVVFDQHRKTQLRNDGLEKKYEYLRLYHLENKHLDIPYDYVTTDGTKIGAWLSDLKTRARSGRLPADKLERLTAIGVAFDSRSFEDRLDDTFATYCERVSSFFTEHGHVNIPKRHVTVDGVKLGEWVVRQRSRARSGKLPDRFMQPLRDLGVIN